MAFSASSVAEPKVPKNELWNSLHCIPDAGCGLMSRAERRMEGAARGGISGQRYTKWIDTKALTLAIIQRVTKPRDKLLG